MTLFLIDLNNSTTDRNVIDESYFRFALSQRHILINLVTQLNKYHSFIKICSNNDL